jgi:hypothetical protein
MPCAFLATLSGVMFPFSVSILRMVDRASPTKRKRVWAEGVPLS